MYEDEAVEASLDSQAIPPFGNEEYIDQIGDSERNSREESLYVDELGNEES